MGDTKVYIDYVAKFIEIIGVLTIVTGAIIALIKFVFTVPGSYKLLRQELGKAILLGLEILVAGDIIGTVATEPTMNRVLSLGVIVLIRIMLSFSLQVELEGRFPWQNNVADNDDGKNLKIKTK